MSCAGVVERNILVVLSPQTTTRGFSRCVVAADGRGSPRILDFLYESLTCPAVAFGPRRSFRGLPASQTRFCGFRSARRYLKLYIASKLNAIDAIPALHAVKAADVVLEGWGRK